MENEKMFNLAISYLNRGWSVLPCGKDKRPLISWKEFQSRKPTPSEILAWFEAFPQAQVGVITGSLSGLTVVDFEKGADLSTFPQETYSVSTGGMGIHLYYQFEERITNKARIRELTDVRSEGGFVVAGGSISEKGPYTVIKDLPLLPFPFELFPESPKSYTIQVDYRQFPVQEEREIASYQGHAQGQRNDEMTRYIGYLLTQIEPDAWDGKAWNLTMLANQRNSPPLNEIELRATFESVKRLERRNNPSGRRLGGVLAQKDVSSAPLGDDPPMLEDEIKHIAEVADEQRIDQMDIYPLQMEIFDDAILGGVNPGDVIAIAGQSGHGKTSLAQDWTLSMLRGPKKAKALWFSYEVLPSHLWKKFQEMGMNRDDMAFIPAKHTTGDIAWVEQKIREGKAKFGIKVVFIDHLGFLFPKTKGILGKKLDSNYAAFLTQIMRDLKTLAIQEEIIIFLPVHMKKVYSRGGAEINDIKDSSGVAQESDLVFLIERERAKDADSHTYFTDVTTITLAKNRKTGQTVVAKFTMINGRFAYDDSGKRADEDFNNYGTHPETTPEPPVSTNLVEKSVEVEDLVETIGDEEDNEGGLPW